MTPVWNIPVPRPERDKPRYYAQCSHCFYEGFSHDSQADADRAVRNHEARCEDNPANGTWRDAHDQFVQVGSRTAKPSGMCALIGALLVSVPIGILYWLVDTIIL